MPLNQLPTSFQFEAIFHEAAIGILVTNARFDILISNEFLDQLFGYEVGELVGQNISVLIPNHLKMRHEGHLKQVQHSPISRPMGVGLDLKAKRKDESLFPIEISLSHFRENEQLYYIAFVSDVTLKRKVEMELILKNQEINQLNESLEEEVLHRTQALQNTLAKLEENTKVLEGALQKEKELGDLKTRFVSMASHEFRTPLTSILSSAALIEKYPKEEEQSKRLQHINRIKNSVNNMTEILEEFLSVGKIAEGHIETHISEIVLAPFFQELLAELRGHQKDAQKIVLHIDKTETFISDASILRKVLINGLSNALKFSERDVHLHVQHKKHELHIDIVDSGIGISEEDQKHLFDRFFRGGNASVIQGTGLGLHLIDRYVRLIQGKVEIYSQLGQGTTLSISIPALI